MTERAENKIMRGLREALAFVRGDTDAGRVTTFIQCRDCGNVVRAADRCSVCRSRIYGEEASR